MLFAAIVCCALHASPMPTDAVDVECLDAAACTSFGTSVSALRTEATYPSVARPKKRRGVLDELWDNIVALLGGGSLSGFSSTVRVGYLALLSVGVAAWAIRTIVRRRLTANSSTTVPSHTCAIIELLPDAAAHLAHAEQAHRSGRQRDAVRFLHAAVVETIAELHADVARRELSASAATPPPASLRTGSAYVQLWVSLQSALCVRATPTPAIVAAWIDDVRRLPQ
jgi:hypothetical protein